MTKYLSILFEYGTSRILVEQDDDGYFIIPYRPCDEVPHEGYKMKECFEYHFEEFFVTSSFELGFLYSTKNEAFHRHIPPLFVAMFEMLNPAELEPDFSSIMWVDPWTIAPERFKMYYDRAILPLVRRIKEECSENGVRPWEKPGWFQMTTEQATLTLNRLGYQVMPPFQQYCISSVGAILTVKTDKGLIYLKASNAREVRTTERISDIEPKLARKPLYVDVENEWMLMEDYGQTLEKKLTMNDFENLKELLGRLQRRSESHVRRLVDCGVPQVEPRDVLRRIEKMVQDVLLSDGLEDALRNSNNREVIEKFDRNEIRRYCDCVKTLLKHLYENQKIPLTLVHGDLHTNNITRSGTEKDSYVLFDWYNARIDLPLTSMDCLPGRVIDVKPQAGTFLESYLEHWAEFGSMEELEEIRNLMHLKESFDILLEEYEYAVDKELRPYLEGLEIAQLCKVMCQVREAVQTLEQ